MNAQLQAEVFDLISRQCPSGPRTVTAADRMVEDLGFNSLNVIELCIDLERHFDLRPISEQAAAMMVTAGDVAELVARLQAPHGD